MSSLFQRRTLGFAAFFLAACLSFAAAAQEPTAVIFCAYNLKNWLQQPPLGGGVDAEPITKPEADKAKASGDVERAVAIQVRTIYRVDA